MPTVSVVTGANSGIGRAISIDLARRGHVVYGTVRDPERAGKLQSMAADAGVEVALVTVDVGDDESVRQGFQEVLDRESHIDVLINNAGIGGNAVVEEATPAQILEVTDINVCGALRCLQAVLPGMRERGQGAIVNISSVVGRFGAIAQAPYVASKWALEGLSEQLALELAPFGIRVIIVEPGITKSAIFAKNTDAPNATGAYDEHYQRMFEFYTAGIARATDPFEVAAVIHEAITTETPKLRYVCSWGGPEIVAGRQVISDEDWVALGAAPDRSAYRQLFKGAFGLDISPPG